MSLWLLWVLLSTDAPPDCFPPGTSAPVVELAGPSRLYALGFSRAGRLAVLELRSGFDDDHSEWVLRVVDLKNDKVLSEKSYRTPGATTDGFCAKHGVAFARALKTSKIEAGKKPPTLEPFSPGGALSLETKAGAKDDAERTPHQIWLKVPEKGSKQLGVLSEVSVDSGEPPVGPPAPLGSLRSPWEARVAVLLQQDMVGTEGLKVPLFRLMGAKLDSGWTR